MSDFSSKLSELEGLYNQKDQMIFESKKMENFITQKMYEIRNIIESGTNGRKDPKVALEEALKLLKPITPHGTNNQTDN